MAKIPGVNTFDGMLNERREKNTIDLLYYNHLESYAPTLIKTWSRINLTSGLNICKMVKKLNLKVDLSQQKAKNQNSWKHGLLLTFREITYLIIKANRMSRLT